MRRDVLRIRLYYWKHGYRDTEVDTAVTQPARTGRRSRSRSPKGQPTRVREVAIDYDSALISEKTRNGSRCCTPNDPLDLIRARLDARAVSERALGPRLRRRGGRHDRRRRHGRRDLADVIALAHAEPATTVGRITIAGNRRSRRRRSAIRSPSAGRPVPAVGRAREPAQPLRVEPVPARGDRRAAAARQREEREHRRDRSAAARSARRARVQQHRLPAVPVALHGVQPVRRRAAARHRRQRSAICSRGSSQGRGPVPRRRGRRARTANVSPYLQPTYNASIDFKQPAFLQRPATRSAFGAFAHRSINPGVFIDRGFGGQATFTHQIAAARAGRA